MASDSSSMPHTRYEHYVETVHENSQFARDWIDMVSEDWKALYPKANLETKVSPKNGKFYASIKCVKIYTDG